MRVVAAGDNCIIKLEDQNSGTVETAANSFEGGHYILGSLPDPLGVSR